MILLSLYDPNPLVIFEALACGIPIICSERAGNAVDFVIDGGISMGEASTVISLLNDQIEVIRQGSGDTSRIE